MEIPGRAFPVQDYYLEDAVEHSGYEVRARVYHAQGCNNNDFPPPPPPSVRA